MVASSLKDSSEVFVNSYSLIPGAFHFDNYVRGWKGFGNQTFALFFRNTFIIVIASVTGVLLSCSFIAYGFARIRFKFKNFWFMTVILTLLLPGQLVIIPQYIIFNNILHWTNTFLPLIVPSFLGAPFFIFLNLQFIRTIPLELDESAKLDGCSRFQIYYKLIVPLIKPALITCAIFEFYWSWDNYLPSLLYLGKPELFNLSIALKMFSDPGSTSDWGAMFAMAALSLIPPIAVFFFFQKYIVEGISTTGLKA
jgi:multiple sugar transport system permease protein